jgi:hypothetical protein
LIGVNESESGVLSSRNPVLWRRRRRRRGRRRRRRRSCE